LYVFQVSILLNCLTSATSLSDYKLKKYPVKSFDKFDRNVFRLSFFGQNHAVLIAREENDGVHFNFLFDVYEGRMETFTASTKSALEEIIMLSKKLTTF
jgi:hypothetical protein